MKFRTKILVVTFLVVKFKIFTWSYNKNIKSLVWSNALQLNYCQNYCQMLLAQSLVLHTFFSKKFELQDIFAKQIYLVDGVEGG